MGEPHLQHLDLQPFLQHVCNGMAVGELLAAESFSLHDSMTAIEIGDPKMDVGLRRGDARTAAELIADGAAPVALAPDTLLAVLDRLMAMEVAWHGGALLPQTILTSLYMLDLPRCVFFSILFVRRRFPMQK